MIKVVTAYPRITIASIIGLTAFAGAELFGFDPVKGVMDIGNGFSSAYKYIKAAGIISAVLGFVFILFRFNIIGLKMAPENSSFMVARRGIMVRDKNGEVVLHDSGRNRWHVINYRQLVPVHFGDRFVELGLFEFALNGITWKANFTLRWRIPKDKKLIELIVTSVSDRNWWDGEFNQLTRAIKEKATGKLGPLLQQAWLDEASETPQFSEILADELFNEALATYGGQYFELIVSPVSRTDAQQGKDGNVAIANAISGVYSSKQSSGLFGWLRER